MIKEISISLPPADAENPEKIKRRAADQLQINPNRIRGLHVIRKSIDARGRPILMRLMLQVFVDEPVKPLSKPVFNFKDCHQSDKKVIIIGAGPAGLFAALFLLESGIQPLILERGKDVRSRRRDLALLNREGLLNPESNYCYGEGGAGTYSDGKLYTRSSKRGNIKRILDLFVHFGADERILVEAHPHIGTNQLPKIITAMREAIIGYGGEIHFEQKLTDFKISNQKIAEVITAKGDRFQGNAVILATGHSARDIFELLHNKNILIEPKPFALGVRLEHPQSLIDQLQYHDPEARCLLPPASYSLVEQINGKGVFSFCMCPGGIIAPASTSENELVVNGWSPSKRNNPFANSGMVVQVEKEDALASMQHLGISENDPLIFMKFQQMVEQNSFKAGGGHFKAPAQRMADFSDNKFSATLPTCSYLPGVTSFNLSQILPGFIYQRLAKGFKAFGKKMKDGGHSFFTNEALVVATESRTSSPVRIPRNNDTLQHPQISNLYPCGEGAGYAGGIVSAAMDGERVANAITQFLL